MDDLMRDEATDGPSIGLLLCRAKNQVVAEYALRDIHKPIGVADIQLTRLLPDELQGTLPTVEKLEAELAELEGSRSTKSNGDGQETPVFDGDG